MALWLPPATCRLVPQRGLADWEGDKAGWGGENTSLVYVGLILFSHLAVQFQRMLICISPYFVLWAALPK